MQHAWWLVALGWIGCNGASKDTDADADADADTDADSDTDTDTDTDVEPAVDGDGDGFASDVDCDDTDETVFPGAPDLCGDDRVTNCDRMSDEGLVTLDGTQGFDDLGAAITAAAPDSEILVCPGTYVGNFIATVPLRMVAFGEPADTILDGNGSGTTLAVPSGSEIVGLTMTGGVGSPFAPGGGLLLTTPGTLVVEDSIVSGNRAEHGGGVGVEEGSVVTLVNTLVEDNFGTDGGGGAWVGVGSVLDLGTGSSIIGNSATLYGAGVALDGGSLIGGVVSGNTTTDSAELEYQDGVLMLDSPYGGAGVSAAGTCTVTGTDISGNLAFEGGGGFSLTYGELTLVDVAVHDNRSYLGGGFSALAGTLRLEGNTEVYANTAYDAGGGVTLLATVIGGTIRDNQGDFLGGGLIPYSSTVEDTVITGNASELGGGIFAYGEVILRNTTISGNRASLGGGVGSDPGYPGYLVNSVTIEGGAITANDANDGGGIFAAWPMTLTGTTVADNTALIGAGLYLDRGAGVTMSAGAVVRNVATEAGGGIWLSGNALFDAAAVDFGDGADDNVPDDVYTGDSQVVGYGAGETFTCDNAGCEPAP